RRVISEYPSHRRIYRDESSLRCRLEHSFHGVFENRSVILFGLLNLCVKRSALERGGRGARENRQRFHLAERERARAIERVDVDGADELVGHLRRDGYGRANLVVLGHGSLWRGVCFTG